jgi:hypothetical protein
MVPLEFGRAKFSSAGSRRARVNWHAVPTSAHSRTSAGIPTSHTASRTNQRVIRSPLLPGSGIPHAADGTNHRAYRFPHSAAKSCLPPRREIASHSSDRDTAHGGLQGWTTAPIWGSSSSGDRTLSKPPPLSDSEIAPPLRISSSSPPGPAGPEFSAVRLSRPQFPFLKRLNGTGPRTDVVLGDTSRRPI